MSWRTIKLFILNQIPTIEATTGILATDNSNIFYYYNKKSSEWIKADESINTAPYTQLNNVPQNPLHFILRNLL